MGRLPGSTTGGRLGKALTKQRKGLPTKKEALKLETKGLPKSRRPSKKERDRINAELDKQERIRNFKPIK